MLFFSLGYYRGESFRTVRRSPRLCGPEREMQDFDLLPPLPVRRGFGSSLLTLDNLNDRQATAQEDIEGERGRG